MSWNHRILAHKQEDESIYFSIHEVFYNGEGIPNGYTSNPITIGSEDLKGIKWTLNRMKECLKKPILWAGDSFPFEYKEV